MHGLDCSRANTLAAFSASKTASRRRKACSCVSPGRMSEERRTGGDCSGAVEGAASAVGAGGTAEPSVLGSSGGWAVAVPDAGAATGAAQAGRRRVFFRLGNLSPDSRWSQRRMVSRPISTPISRRPPTSASADSPAWLSRSNSSRCGSSWAVAWLRGCRAWATAWASVVGRGAMSGEWMGNAMGANAAHYAWWSGRARGAPGAHSKPAGLDVGVLTYLFLMFWLHRLCSFFGFLVGWLIGLVDLLVLGFGSMFELDYLISWIHGFLKFQGKFFLGLFALHLVAGGGGC